MNLLSSLQSFLGGKTKRRGKTVARSSRWHRLHVEVLESRDLPSLTPSGLITGAGGFDMPNFTWTAVSGTNHYVLDVIDNSTGKVPIAVANISGSATSYQATVAQALTPGHSFTTDLYAFSTNTQYSLRTQTFTLAALAAPASLSPSATIPASSGFDTPTFAWSAVAGANHYYLKVVDNNTGQVPIVIPNVSGTSYTPTAVQALTPGHSFTTYVYAYSTNSQAFKLSTRTFTLAALAAPTSLSPSATIPASSGYDTPTFAWTAVTGANHYYLKVVDNNTGQAPIVIPNVSGTSYTPTAAQALTPGHSFTIYVYAFSTNSKAYSLSTQRITLAALAAPTSLSPSATIPASSGYDTPTFAWSAVTGANHYYLKVVDNNTGLTPIVIANVSGTSYTPTAVQALTPGHSFTTYVYAFSTNSKAYSLSTQRFTLAALAAPTSLSPSATIPASSGYDTPTFAWNAVTGANHYYLKVVDNNTGQAPIVIPNVSGTSYTPTAAQALTPGHSFTIYVYAFSTNSKAYSLSTQRFTLAALVAPSLISGPSGTIQPSSGFDTPALTWSSVSGASHYYLLVVDNTANVTVINNSNVSTNSFTPTASLTPGHSYTWYVAAKSTNGKNSLAFSSQTFNLAALAAPTQSGPSGTISTTSPSFAWNNVSGANHYYVRLVDTTTNVAVINNPNVNTNSFTPSTPLTPGHSFIWYVAAVSNNGKNTLAFSSQTFTLATAALATPSLISGPSGTVSTTSPSFAWTNVSGANHYFLRLVDTTTNVIVINNSNVSTNSFTLSTPLTPGNSYTWSVSAQSSNGQGAFSSQTFNLAALAAPSLASGLSGTIAPSSGFETPTFSWGSVPWANYYRLNVVDTTTGALAINVPNVIGTSYTATAAQALTPGHSFTTYVYAFTTSNQAYSLSKQTFALPALAAPTNLTPIGIIPISAGYQMPTFTWSQVVGANHYYLKVVDNNTGLARIVVPNVSGTSYTTTAAQALTPGHSFTFYVYAFSANNQASSLNTQAFTLGVAPTATLVAPATVNEGSPFSVALTNPYDPTNPDTAGFHYAFAVDGASMTGVTYANAGASASQNFSFTDGLSSHTITERILAAEGDFTDYTATVQLNYVPPTATIGGPYTGIPGSAISFTGSATDPSAPDTAAGFQYSWHFGDGGTSTLQSPSHTYANAGVYTVTLAVSDTDGGTSSVSTTSTVSTNTLQAVTLDGTSYALVGSPATFSLSNPNLPPTGGFTYSWNFGDGATATTSIPTASHAYTSAGNYTTTVAVSDDQGDQAFSSAPITVDPSSDSSNPLFTPVVNQSSFTYLGSFALPESANGWDTAYSMGGLADRYVNGNLQFFTTNHIYSGGLVYSFNYPGISTNQSSLPQAQVITNWGDIYTGQKEFGGDTSLNSSTWTYGLDIDPTSGDLYWTYGNNYNDSYQYNPSIGYSTLNDTTGVATGVGAWSLTNRPEKMDRGGILQIPSWFANAYTGGDTLGVGFGGYFSINATASQGAALAAIAPPNLATNPDDSSLANIPLIGYPIGAPDEGHRDTDYTTYYNGGTYPTTPSANDPASVPVTPPTAPATGR